MSDGKYPVRTRFGEMLRRSQISNPGNGGSGVGSGSGSPVLFTYDRWVLTADGAQTKTLTYLPVDGSAHVYLNGVGQDETVDYDLDTQTLTVHTAAAALTGDVLWARYAYDADSPMFVPDSTGEIEDTFDRPDQTGIGTASDGGNWITSASSNFDIQSNSAVCSIGSDNVPIRRDLGSSNAEVTLTLSQSAGGAAVRVAWLYLGFDATGIADGDPSAADAYRLALSASGAFQLWRTPAGGSPSSAGSTLTGTSWSANGGGSAGGPSTIVVTFDAAAGSVTIVQDGVTVGTITDPSPLAVTGTWVGVSDNLTWAASRINFEYFKAVPA